MSVIFDYVNELKKATDNFNEEWKLGQGCQGIVYKGMLGEGKIVAVKKSNKLEENQLRNSLMKYHVTN